MRGAISELKRYLGRAGLMGQVGWVGEAGRSKASHTGYAEVTERLGGSLRVSASLRETVFYGCGASDQRSGIQRAGSSGTSTFTSLYSSFWMLRPSTRMSTTVATQPPPNGW